MIYAPMLPRVDPDYCECYECVGPNHYWVNGTKHIQNNMKYHTFFEECSKCGHRKTEYLDLGTKGYYICWYCNERTAEPGAL